MKTTNTSTVHPKFLPGDLQVIAPVEEMAALALSIEQTQDAYKEKGFYDEFDNLVEERISELWIFDYLQEHLSNWTLEPMFKGIGRYDVKLTHKKTGMVKFIEIKTKLEKPDFYMPRYYNPAIIDRTGSMPYKKLDQVTTSDFVVWAMTSRMIPSSQTASSSCVIGVSVGPSLDKNDFEKVSKPGQKPYYFLDPRKAAFLYRGKDSLQKLVEYLKSY